MISKEDSWWFSCFWTGLDSACYTRRRRQDRIATMTHQNNILKNMIKLAVWTLSSSLSPVIALTGSVIYITDRMSPHITIGIIFIVKEISWLQITSMFVLLLPCARFLHSPLLSANLNILFVTTHLHTVLTALT
ncbi:uncharacterized protein V1513DRAFT_448634 [Lipomyces chichibuensis]|uniref:uncharacterized protein n=1 Tax=Lipomyces chichibuensis TaxID=1546026 RepID=UPI00334381A3